MAVARANGVRISGVACAAPDKVRTTADEARVFGDEEARKIGENTGIERRHLAGDDICASDLCVAAADKLLDELGWERDSIELLIFVTQTPDYVMPATACSLQHRLGLPKSCAALDVNLSCSGYVYGLWLASQLTAAGSARRALLLVGDTLTRIVSPEDRTTAPLFGDAGSATALEADADAAPMTFVLGTNGEGCEHLVAPAGGFRQRSTSQTSIRKPRSPGVVRSEEDLYLNGPEIFLFTLRAVPPLVRETMAAADWDFDMVDTVVFHQANKFILKHLAGRLKVPDDKLVLAMRDFGNTSSASIPLAMTTALREQLAAEPRKLLLTGFGAGYSWGAAAITCGPIVAPELVIVPSLSTAAQPHSTTQTPSAA